MHAISSVQIVNAEKVNEIPRVKSPVLILYLKLFGRDDIFEKFLTRCAVIDLTVSSQIRVRAKDSNLFLSELILNLSTWKLLHNESELFLESSVTHLLRAQGSSLWLPQNIFLLRFSFLMTTNCDISMTRRIRCPYIVPDSIYSECPRSFSFICFRSAHIRKRSWISSARDALFICYWKNIIHEINSPDQIKTSTEVAWYWEQNILL